MERYNAVQQRRRNNGGDSTHDEQGRQRVTVQQTGTVLDGHGLVRYGPSDSRLSRLLPETAPDAPRPEKP